VSEKANPRQAATVILLREAKSKGFEVFLTRRPEGMPFLRGMYCFPGGGVTKEDCSIRAIERCRGLTAEQARKIVGAQFSPRQAVGFWVAAVRELFEEAGVLLAVSSSGARVPASKRSGFGNHDQALFEKPLSFTALLASKNLYYDLASLVYLSHWQSPAQTSLRFDTRFFIAALPYEQTPPGISYERAHSLWLAPEVAMQRYARGELPMIFPIFASLRTLADFETLESVMKEFRGRYSATAAASSRSVSR
jgi:8-oxo-dGTP pyrophosphatase MutT (NUDIX family)